MPNLKNVEYFDQNQILFINYRYGEWLSKRNLTVSKILEYGIIVNKERTLIWLRPDGSWVVKPKHL